MKVKKYEAQNMQEALLKIKADLGPNAIILHTRKIIKGGMFGLFGREKIEVLAATDTSGFTDNDTVFQDIQEKFRSVQGELKEIKNFIHLLVKQIRMEKTTPHFPPPYHDWFLKLLKNEVEEKLSTKIIQEVQEGVTNPQDQQLIRSKILQKIIKIFGETKPIRIKDGEKKTVALIGPTGAGKTTTIAKLAAIFNLRERKKVALLTVDTYRIAAVEQLIKYAEIMRIPFEVIFSPWELKEGIKKHQDKDLILIDTAGRSQKDTRKVQELAEFMEAANPVEIHLVLSATTKYNDLLDVYERFSVVPINMLLFTKLDETTSFGGILNVASRVGKPLSYLTVGQNVPQDIEEASSEKLANLIVGDEGNA